MQAHTSIYSHGPSHSDYRQPYSVAQSSYYFKPQPHYMAPAQPVIYHPASFHFCPCSFRGSQVQMTSSPPPKELVTSTQKAITPRMTPFERATQSILGIARQHSNPTDLRKHKQRDFSSPLTFSKHKSVSRLCLDERSDSPLVRKDETLRLRLADSASRRPSKQKSALMNPETDFRRNLGRDSLRPDHFSNVASFRLSNQFKKFCSMTLSSQRQQASHRRIQRRAKTLKGNDDSFFFGKVRLASEKAPSTSNTIPSQNEEPGSAEEVLKVED